jgi:hypothetical protein
VGRTFTFDAKYKIYYYRRRLTYNNTLPSKQYTIKVYIIRAGALYYNTTHT